MRAVLVEAFGPIENAKIGDAPDPTPGRGEVLVDIKATAANFVDLLLIGGTHQSRPALPYIPGKGPAGKVLAVGDGVSDFAPGDRVLAMCEPGGGFAERIALPASFCHEIPDALDYADAASMALIYDTAWLSLNERGRFAPGETVLILGSTGGVGLAAIALTKAMGGRALAAVASPDKADLVLEAGADAVIDLTADNLRDSLRKQVLAATDGIGADVVIDPLGGEIFDAAIRAVAWRGRYVVIGFAAGGIPTLKINYLLVKNIDVGGLQIADYRKRRPDIMAQAFDEIFALYEDGRIAAPPKIVLPFERFADALSAIKDRSARGRIVMVQDTAVTP